MGMLNWDTHEGKMSYELASLVSNMVSIFAWLKIQLKKIYKIYLKKYYYNKTKIA